MKPLKYIANLGYGTRREVKRMFAEGRITRADGAALDENDVVPHDEFRVDGMPLDPPPGSVIMLHKPVGYVCSTNDTNSVIYDLLPYRFRERSPIMAPVGRLDLDTSGLLLLTDDGQINHRIASPRTHLDKTYDAVLADDISTDIATVFASGALMLTGEDIALNPAVVDVVDARHARVTITEGRYHQVRRMFAAVGNHVVSLHRSAVGPLVLNDLGPGCWRVLEPSEMAALQAALSGRDRQHAVDEEYFARKSE